MSGTVLRRPQAFMPNQSLWKRRLPPAAHLSTTTHLRQQQKQHNDRYSKEARGLTPQDKKQIAAYDHDIAKNWTKLQRLEHQDLRASKRERAKERLQADMAYMAAKARLYDVGRDFRPPADNVVALWKRNDKLWEEGRFRKILLKVEPALQQMFSLKMRSAVPTIFAPWRDDDGVMDRAGRVATTVWFLFSHAFGVSLMRILLWGTKLQERMKKE